MSDSSSMSTRRMRAFVSMAISASSMVRVPVPKERMVNGGESPNSCLICCLMVSYLPYSLVCGKGNCWDYYLGGVNEGVGKGIC